MCQHDRVGREHSPNLASATFKTVRAPAGEVRYQPDMVFFIRRYPKHLAKSGNFVAADVAIRPRHLAAESDSRDRKSNPVAAVGIGEVGSVPMPGGRLVGGMIEQCTKRAAKR